MESKENKRKSKRRETEKFKEKFKNTKKFRRMKKEEVAGMENVLV